MESIKTNQSPQNQKNAHQTIVLPIMAKLQRAGEEVRVVAKMNEGVAEVKKEGVVAVLKEKEKSLFPNEGEIVNDLQAGVRRQDVKAHEVVVEVPFVENEVHQEEDDLVAMIETTDVENLEAEVENAGEDPIVEVQKEGDQEVERDGGAHLDVHEDVLVVKVHPGLLANGVCLELF